MIAVNPYWGFVGRPVEAAATHWANLERDVRAKYEKIAALQGQVEQRDADIAARDKSIAEERKAKEAVERELEKAHSATKAAEERASKAEATLVERDVDALVGIKITPAERDEQLELAKSNRSLFDKLIAKRANIGGGDGLVDTKGQSRSVLGDDKPQERAPAAGVDHDNSASLRDFQKSLGN